MWTDSRSMKTSALKCGKCLVSVTSMLLVMLEDLIYRKIMSIFCGFLKKFMQKTPNIKLLLLGEGELFSKIQNLAEDLEIKDKIIFAGVHKDVENYYQAMDAFVLPSLFEGLPVTGIEAQYSGLPCFFSDEVTREVKICSDTKFLKIGNENLGLWVDAISQQRINKERNRIELITKKFDIRTAAKSMEKRYIDLWKQSNS